MQLLDREHKCRTVDFVLLVNEMDYEIFGCKVNKFYINKWMEYFELHPSFAQGDKCIIATCVVTDRAKAKRVKSAKKRLKTGQFVYLTGCGAFEK